MAKAPYSEEDKNEVDVEDEGFEGLDEDEDMNDEEEEGIRMDFNEDEEEDAFPSNPRSKHTPLKPPTGPELAVLQSSAALYKSTLFKLQLDQLLPAVRFKQAHAPALDAFLHAFHDFLIRIPESAAVHPVEGREMLAGNKDKAKAKGKGKGKAKAKGVQVPYCFPLPSPDAKWTVAYKKPTRVNIVGSYPDNMAVKAKDGGGWNVDIALDMPDDIFHPKDFLNARFLHKRAFYLAYIASHLNNAADELGIEVSYDVPGGDPRLVRLLVRANLNHDTPKSNSNSDTTTFPPNPNIRIHILATTSPTNPINIAHLSPTHSNIRIASTNVSEPSTTNPNPNPSIPPNDDNIDSPTPLYNTITLTHTTPPLTHLIHIHALTSSVPGFRDAVALLRVWSAQRGYSRGNPSSSHDAKVGESNEKDKVKNAGYNVNALGFDVLPVHVFFSAVLAVLIEGEEPQPFSNTNTNTNGKKTRNEKRDRKVVGRGLSSYQLFRAGLDFLARHDFSQSAVFLKTNSGKGHLYSPHSFPLPALVDWTGRVNLLAGVPLGTLDMLRHDARVTLQTLDADHGSGSTSDTESLESFNEVFMRDKRDLFERFDVVLSVDLSPAHPRTPSPHTILEHGSPTRALLYDLCALLRRALSDRAMCVGVFVPPSAVVPVIPVVPVGPVEPQSQSSPSVSQSQSAPTSMTQPLGRVYIALVLNPDPGVAFRLVDHGPSLTESPNANANTANPEPSTSESPANTEIAAFTTLWGPRASLRRFKDGSITHAAVWSDLVSSTDEKTLVPAHIVRFVLEHHFAVPGGNVRGLQGANRGKGVQGVQGGQGGGGFDEVLRYEEGVRRLGKLDIAGGNGSNLAKVGFRKALEAFEAFVKVLRDLGEEDGVPLGVLSVSPTSGTGSGALRYTSAYQPLPLSIFPSNSASVPVALLASRLTPRIPLALQFERSSRWPDDLRAMRAMKMAFLERIASVLMGKESGCKAGVVLVSGEGGGSEEEIGEPRMEVITAEGWVFEVGVWLEREGVLLEREVEEAKKGSVSVLGKRKLHDADETNDRETSSKTIQKSAQTAQRALTAYTRRFLHAPKHHRAIAALHHRFAAYSGTTRLVKRWLAAHWLMEGHHVSEEAVELICASVFLGRVGAGSAEGEEGARRIDVPVTKERGFARVVAFLKEWKWENGLYVPLYSTSDGNQTNVLAQALRVSSAGASSVWIIATEEDPSGRMWTEKGPGVLVANRLKMLARATWEGLRAAERGVGEVKTLFMHPTGDYDFLIHVEPLLYGVGSMAAGQKEIKNVASSELRQIRPGFDPVALFYDDLKHVYSGTLEFFYDPYISHTIGALWAPTLSEPRSFRVLLGYSSMPVPSGKNKKKDLVTINKQAIIAEIRRLGEGIVKSIQVQHEL